MKKLMLANGKRPWTLSHFTGNTDRIKTDPANTFSTKKRARRRKTTFAANETTFASFVLRTGSPIF
jgi:hypothetical protein